MIQAFISYAREDEKSARHLAMRLERVGVHAWVGLDEISLGDSWSAVLQNRLQRSDLVFVIASPHAERSQFVAIEIALALSEASSTGARVIPVFPNGKARPPVLLEHVHGLSLYDETIDRQLESLVETVRSKESVSDHGQSDDAGMAYVRSASRALAAEEGIEAVSRKRRSSAIALGFAAASVISVIVSVGATMYGYIATQKAFVEFAQSALAEFIQSQSGGRHSEDWEIFRSVPLIAWWVPFVGGLAAGVLLSAGGLILRGKLSRRLRTTEQGE